MRNTKCEVPIVLTCCERKGQKASGSREELCSPYRWYCTATSHPCCKQGWSCQSTSLQAKRQPVPLSSSWLTSCVQQIGYCCWRVTWCKLVKKDISRIGRTYNVSDTLQNMT